MAETIESLPPEDRIIHYRAMASEVQYLANEAQFEEVREQFIKLAQSWRGIADRLERNLIERESKPAPASVAWPHFM